MLYPELVELLGDLVVEGPFATPSMNVGIGGGIGGSELYAESAGDLPDARRRERPDLVPGARTDLVHSGGDLSRPIAVLRALDDGRVDCRLTDKSQRGPRP